jgi:hypothetical protein
MIESAVVSVSQIKDLFDEQCNDIGKFLDKNPDVYKAAIATNHLVKAIMVFATMTWSPLSAPVTGCAMLASSLLYRASIERFCSFRFTVMSLLGATAISMTVPALTAVAAGTAFTSIGAAFATGAELIPLGLYCTGVVILSGKDVDSKLSECCYKSMMRQSSSESSGSSRGAERNPPSKKSSFSFSFPWTTQ